MRTNPKKLNKPTHHTKVLTMQPQISNSDFRFNIVALLLNSACVSSDNVVSAAIPIYNWVMGGGDVNVVATAAAKAVVQTEVEPAEDVKEEPVKKTRTKKVVAPEPEPEEVDELDGEFDEEPLLPEGKRDQAYYDKHVKPLLTALAAKDKPAALNLVRVVYKVQKGNEVPADNWDELVNSINKLLAA